MAVLQTAGFDEASVKERFDCFQGTTKERTARKYGVSGVNVHAVRRA